MIDVQLYRAKIGALAFSSPASSGNYLVGRKGKLGEHLNWSKFLITSWKQRERAGSGNVFMLLIYLPFVCVIILVLFKVAQKVARDIESNPEPYDLLKSVQGNFSQGNVDMFGETAGHQCACNALFSICRSLVRKIIC